MIISKKLQTRVQGAAVMAKHPAIVAKYSTMDRQSAGKLFFFFAKTHNTLSLSHPSRERRRGSG
jgi:hypothetical protein